MAHSKENRGDVNSLVEFERVSRAFDGPEILREVSLKIGESRHVALLGPSGCGKTTMLRLLAGLDHPGGGRILIEGETVSERGRIVVPPHARRIGMVFQDLALWPNLSASDNVLLGNPCSDGGRRERAERTREVLKICGLDGLGNRKPGELSVGQQQRVAIARALAVRPRLLLLDEPFTGLDLTLKQQLVHEIAALAEQFEITLVLVTHDPWEVRALCSDAVVLEEGRIAEHGKISTLLDGPSTETMRAMAQQIGKSR